VEEQQDFHGGGQPGFQREVTQKCVTNLLFKSINIICTYRPRTFRTGSHISLDNRLTDGGKVVSLMRRPPYNPQEYSWYSFLLEAESTPGS
jgi:hypothetical protein